MADPHRDHATLEDAQLAAPWEHVFERITTPFERFIHNQTSAGLLLMVVALLTLLLANSPWSTAYEHLLHTPLSLRLGEWSLELSLQHWVNDGLMALFFFLVGLEIKRELLVGELASVRKAALPIVAAVGGMVVPAAIYFLVNPEGDAARGWGIPMATDIAFAVGALVLLGRRIPRNLIIFLAALAIVDDLGAVVVIALFYTDDLALIPLAWAGALLASLIALNLGGVRRPLPYFLAGILMWFAMLQSGIHATVAGVLLAFTIPTRPRYHPERFSSHVRKLMDRYDHVRQPGVSLLENPDQASIVQALEAGVERVQPPLARLERAFHLPVGLLVIPVFALFNAGIPIEFTTLAATLSHPVTFGVMSGLLIGKFLGITGASYLASRYAGAALPDGVNMRHIIGVGLLGGIGFTMSIFIGELAFATLPEHLLMAKTGILAASLAAGTLGYAWLLWATRSDASP